MTPREQLIGDVARAISGAPFPSKASLRKAEKAVLIVSGLCAWICEDEQNLTHDGYDLTGFRGQNGALRSAATRIRDLSWSPTDRKEVPHA